MRESGVGSKIHRASAGRSTTDQSYMASLPLVISLNCLEDTSFEQEALGGLASVENVSLSQLADGRIESAAAVVLHSLSLLPRAAQRRLQPWQVILCLGSTDRAVDSALAADLGLRLVHIDVSRAEEIADTVMALFLALLRRTHLLSRHSSSSSASGWLGSIQPLCRGMRRCRGLVLGIIGRSASARCLATRSLAFRMNVLYFDVQEINHAKGSRWSSIRFPSAARRMDTLNDLLAASDLVSLHCASSDDAIPILDAECLQHIKPGAFIVNTSSSQLIDDCALKQLLIDGTIAGCALDGAEGPQWMEAWVREMPNVLILPRSADYSEEVWMEIREKAISMLQSFFIDRVIPNNNISDDEDKSDVAHEDDQAEKQVIVNSLQAFDAEQKRDDKKFDARYDKKHGTIQLKESQASGLSHNNSSRSEGRHSRSGKKSKKRPALRSSQHKSDDYSGVEGSYSSHQDDDTAISGMDLSSRFASPEDSKNKQICLVESMESISQKPVRVSGGLDRKSYELLKDGFVIVLHARDCSGFLVSRKRASDGAWFLDTSSSVTKRDPATQFLVAFRSKDTLGLRSFVAGGNLLQINRKLEFVFANHNFDVWESWMLEGSSLEECRLVNCRDPLLQPLIEIHHFLPQGDYCSGIAAQIRVIVHMRLCRGWRAVSACSLSLSCASRTRPSCALVATCWLHRPCERARSPRAHLCRLASRLCRPCEQELSPRTHLDRHSSRSRRPYEQAWSSPLAPRPACK
ncbi:C-terminal binding protein AN [Apostasia shenzhenica]|uniref:C-terminal binding protein AN n=1 Tax=Apostasia shenzhenica TaxID=1088818 RepID=A0A2I0AY27_9ASPA|nr:C-terminal binding protein AN [Apostasia shenzhenica]